MTTKDPELPYTDSPYLVPFDGSFTLSKAITEPDKETLANTRCKKWLKQRSRDLYALQRTLYADNRHSLLLIFQAMDAAGKDSTIRHVFSGVNPAGFQVSSFKQPSKEELDHDFLWRSSKALPERGRIGIFNRSYYEETLVVRVHPEYLAGQRIPQLPALDDLWPQRFASIRNHEEHLAQNGTTVLKFFLNVSQEEQHKRFRDRIDEPESQWKFSAGDLKESALWPKYMQAYEDCLQQTSRPLAPWYAIPADHKPYMRYVVADIVARTLENMAIRYPEPSDADRDEMLACREQLLPTVK